MVTYLIVRFSSIGDIVLTTPVVRNLKEQTENSRILFLTKIQHYSILENNPYIDKIFTIDNNFRTVIKQLKSENIDYIIDLHNNLRTKRVKAAIHRVAFTFNKINYKKYLAVKLKKISALPDNHIVDRYMYTIRHFIDKNDNKGLDYFIPDNDKLNFNNELFDDIKDNKYIACVIGAKHYTKRIHDDLIVNISNKLNFPVILIGGKEEESSGENIIKKSDNIVKNACGRFNLNQSASLIKNSQLVITGDTGLMHIAAAFNKIVLSIWGNTIPEFGMTPYKANELSKIFEIKNLKCRPCSKLGYEDCPKKHFKCMLDINPNEISSYANDVMEQENQ